MKKKFYVTTTLMALLAGLAGCGNDATSSSSSNRGNSSTVNQNSSAGVSSTASSSVVSTGTSSSSSTITSTGGSSSVITSSSTSSSSSNVVLPTEALTEEMFAGLKGGYSAETVRTTLYEGSTPSYSMVDIDVNEKNYAFKKYTTVDGVTRKNLTNDCHYQVNPEEVDEMLYDAGLSIGNTVIYSPVLGRDPFTFSEIHLTWEEGYFSNVFANLSVDNFTRVGEENKFALELGNTDLEYDGVYEKIDAQFFGSAVDAEIEYFHLLTNGDQIVGFDLKYEGYISYESMVYREAKGTFTNFGTDVTSFVTPLEGREKDKEFDDAIASLKEYNYKVNHTQSGFDFTAEKFVGRGHFEGEADGKALNYYYFNNSNQKTMNYAYYNVEEDGETYLQGATNINGTYYNDVAYFGSLADILPSFNVSSEMFIKSSESTDTVLVYDLDKSIKISLDNNNATYSSFDSDGYNDRTVYLTITIDKNEKTINFHNETSAEEDSGLIEDVTYSNIGEVGELITSENLSDNCDNLSWEELLSNDEVGLKALVKKVPNELLEGLPTLGDRYSLVYYDAGSSILFVTTYEQTENDTLLEGYGQKLVDAGFTAEAIEEGVAPSYSKVFTSGSRSYKLTLSLMTYWNANLGWGQFQIALAVTGA